MTTFNKVGAQGKTGQGFDYKVTYVSGDVVVAAVQETDTMSREVAFTYGGMPFDAEHLRRFGCLRKPEPQTFEHEISVFYIVVRGRVPDEEFDEKHPCLYSDYNTQQPKVFDTRQEAVEYMENNRNIKSHAERYSLSYRVEKSVFKVKVTE